MSFPVRDVGRFALASRAEGDTIHLHRGAEREGGAADGDPGRGIGPEHLQVGVVHLAERRHVGQVNVHLGHVGQAAAARGQDDLDVAESLPGLRGDAAGHEFQGTVTGTEHPGDEDLITGHGGVAEGREAGHTRDVNGANGWHAAFPVRRGNPRASRYPWFTPRRECP